MRPFDANDYRSRVLAPIHARGGAEHSDPFEIYDIPLEDVAALDDAAVTARIDEVWAFWQRSRDHPRYRGVVLALLARHSELTEALRTRAARTELAARVAQARAEREDGRFAAVDAAVARLVERFGGLPEDKIPGLRKIARDAGLGDDEFERRIARHRRVGAGAAERTTRRPVPPEVLRQVRSDLDELGRIVGEDPPRSLFELLGVPPGTDRDAIRAMRDEALARNRARRPDRRRALLDDLLAAVTNLLVDGDPEAYLDGLAAAAADLLRPRLAAAVLVEDRLLPADAAALVTAAQAEGLDPARAAAVVRALAREAGVDDAGVATPADSRDTRRADSRAGPRAGARTTPPVLTTPSVPPARGGSDDWTGADPPPDWRDALTLARTALAAGTPIAASDQLARALEIAGSALPPIRSLGDEIETAIRRAGERWAELARAVADRRLAQARRLAADLARTGRDVPGPDGAELTTVTEAIEAGHRRADELLASAATTAPAERAALALAALDLVADSAEARDLLAENLAPPTALVVIRGSGAVEIRWAPSATPAARYRVTRVGADGATRTVGMTEATFIEDGGVPAGAELPGYEVRAGVGGAWSRPAVWPTPTGAADDRSPGALTEQTGSTSGTAGTSGAAAGAPPEAADDDRTQLIARTPADALEPARDLAIVAGRLRWTWPDGCTEVIVTWRQDAPPIAANDPVAQSRKVTNTRYELDGGFTLPATRPLHVAVFGCLRDPAGRLVVASTASPDARRHLPARDRL
ncbi:MULTISPECIES: hypothetical protein [Pseudofrankia]|uniref:hypothetical protein n=1 Tax=Pseudofrankia TaxID=2994363 RepID=UPI000234B9E6|nr:MULTISPECIES: hypothetical protein [Pseudofrankia]OHV38262.1 hypothetical protein BCD49_14290 [Pseudofrankia sp. EUN1h]